MKVLREKAGTLGALDLCLTAASGILLLISPHVRSAAGAGWQGLPIAWFNASYFAGLVLLGCATGITFVSASWNAQLAAAQTLVLISALWIVPPLMGFAPLNFAAMYTNFGYVDPLLRSGHLDPSRIWYHSWPGGWVTVAFLAEVVGIKDPTILLGIAPAVIAFALLPVLYVLFRGAFEGRASRSVWGGIFLFYVANWVGQLHLTAQTFGYLLVLSLIAVWVARRQMQAVIDRPASMILLTYSASVTITHLLSAIVMLAFLVATSIKRGLGKPSSATLLAVMIAGWLVYTANPFFKSNVAQIIKEIFRLDELIRTGLLDRFAGNVVHQFANAARLLLSGGLTLLALAGYVSTRTSSGSGQLFARLTVALAVLFIGLGAGYGFEGLYRGYLFVLPFFAYFAATLLQTKRGRVMIAVSLPPLLALTPVAFYGNQPIDYLSPATKAGLTFLSQRVHKAYLAEDFPLFGSRVALNREAFTSISATAALNGPITSDVPTIFPVSDLDYRYYDFLFNQPRAAEQVVSHLAQNTRYVLFYSSTGMRIFLGAP